MRITSLTEDRSVLPCNNYVEFEMEAMVIMRKDNWLAVLKYATNS